MREAVCFSVVLKSIWVGEYNTIISTTAKKMAQLQNKMYNCQKNGTTAKLYLGIIQEISTTAKKMAQMRNKMYNCQKNCTTAKHIYCSCTFFGNNHFSLSLQHFIPFPTPCHRATAEAMVGTYLPYTSRAAPVLSMYMLVPKLE